MANNNDKKVLNVPALRFPEFSGEWKKCKVQTCWISIPLIHLVGSSLNMTPMP